MFPEIILPEQRILFYCLFCCAGSGLFFTQFLFADNQTLNGKIIVDEISSLLLTLSEESSFEGSINSEQEGGKITVTLDDSSTWKLTGDSYITSFEGSLDNIDSNGYTLYIDGVAQNIG